MVYSLLGQKVALLRDEKPPEEILEASPELYACQETKGAIFVKKPSKQLTLLGSVVYVGTIIVIGDRYVFHFDGKALTPSP